MARYFTVQEANEALKVIRPLVKALMDLRQAVLRRQPELWPVLQKALGNGGSKAASQAAAEFAHMERLVQQIQAAGAELKDVNTGLLDFLALRDGNEVYLCWRYGEDEIAYWHDLDTGFAGRQPL